MQLNRKYMRLAAAALVVGPSITEGAAVVVDLDEPTLDRWNYPFNQSPGIKATAKVFGALTETGFDPRFDNRDGQMLIGFDTSGAVPTCLGASGYAVTAARITVQVFGEETFAYDPTQDLWTSYLLPGDPGFTADPDTGRPVELFGVAYRNGFEATTYGESDPYCAACNCVIGCKGERNAFPTDLEGGATRDVSNSVDDQFDPDPFAVAQIDGVTPGDPVPTLATMSFDLDLGDPDVQAYVGDALDQGMLMVMVTAMFPSEQQVGGTFPELITRENLAVDAGLAHAATLHLTVDVIGTIGDLDGDGLVTTVDLLDLLAAWGSCPGGAGCPGDVDCSGTVDTVDLLALLASWS